MNSTQHKVVITGGAGFIGSHVLKALLVEKVPVRVFDSLISGTQENIPDGVEFVQGDVRDITAVRDALEGATHVIHLAALVSVAESMANPLETHEVNVTGFQNVLDVAREKKITRVVYASSAAIYGDHPQLPKEENLPVAPRSPYALSKVQNELTARMYTEVYSLSTIGLRFFNVYGPGQKGDHPYASVVPRFVEAIKAGKDLEVFGDGRQTRDFIHVDDVAKAVIAALQVPEGAGHVFNVASGKEVSLLELISLIEETIGQKITVAHHPSRPGDLARSFADVGLTQRRLGFSSTIPLKDGIKELF